jgi:hypothetical protein
MDEDLRIRYRLHRPASHPTAAPRPQPTVINSRPASTAPAISFSPPQRPPAAKPVREALPEAAVQTPAKTKTRRKKASKKLFLSFLLLLIIAGCAAGGYFWYSGRQPASPVPAAVVSSVDFPILYPVKLPAGYFVDPSSYHTSDAVLVYSASGSGSNRIAFSVQSKPANFDFNSFYKQLLGGAVPFTNSIGQAAIGHQSGGRIVGSLVTDQSWLLISAPADSLSADSLRTIINNIEIIPAK